MVWQDHPSSFLGSLNTLGFKVPVVHQDSKGLQQEAGTSPRNPQNGRGLTYDHTSPPSSLTDCGNSGTCGLLRSRYK